MCETARQGLNDLLCNCKQWLLAARGTLRRQLSFLTPDSFEALYGLNNFQLVQAEKANYENTTQNCRENVPSAELTLKRLIFLMRNKKIITVKYT